MSRTVVPLMAFVAACSVALVLIIQSVHREPLVDTEVVTAAPEVSKQASLAQDQEPAAFAAAQSEANSVAAALAGSSATPDSGDGVPAFDIARIEPTGEAVIAGRAAPGATVELLRNGQLHDQAVADQSGEFAMVPPRLPPGTYELRLRSRQPDGKLATSKQSVAVSLEPSPKDPSVVALMTPDKPIQQAVALGDRVVLMHRGRIVESIGGARKRQLRVEELLDSFDRLRNADQVDESAADMLRRLYI